MKALLGSFGTTGACEDSLSEEIFTVSCLFPGVCDNEDVDLVASSVDVFAVSFTWPENRTGEPFEATLASRRLKSKRSMMMVTATTALVVRVRCEGRWDVGDSMLRRDRNLWVQHLHAQQWCALYTECPPGAVSAWWLVGPVSRRAACTELVHYLVLGRRVQIARCHSTNKLGKAHQKTYFSLVGLESYILDCASDRKNENHWCGCATVSPVLGCSTN